MSKEQLEFLHSQDWEEISAKVLKAASIYAARYGWTLNSLLPKGNTLEDIVFEAIADIWDDPQRINEKITITQQLKGIVRSKLYNRSRYVDENIKRLDNLDEIAFATDSDPSYKVDYCDEFDQAIEFLSDHPKVKNKEDHGLVVLAMSDGAFEISEIVEMTSLTKERVYQVKRELSEIYPSIASKLLPLKGAE